MLIAGRRRARQTGDSIAFLVNADIHIPITRVDVHPGVRSVAPANRLVRLPEVGSIVREHLGFEDPHTHFEQQCQGRQDAELEDDDLQPPFPTRSLQRLHARNYPAPWLHRRAGSRLNAGPFTRSDGCACAPAFCLRKIEQWRRQIALTVVRENSNDQLTLHLGPLRNLYGRRSDCT